MTDINTYKETILSVFPQLKGAQFKPLTMGWHSTAVDVDDRLIFKFPKHQVAKRALLKEARLLEVIRPVVSMTVPNIEIHEGPPTFSYHRKLKGDHLLRVEYEGLSEATRQRMAAELARFYAQLHELDAQSMANAGAEAIEAWQTPDAIRAIALPALTPALRSYAEAIVEAFENLPDDPYGTTFGFFDGHGWNMAFDHAQEQLTGIYDFGDSGFGPLHQEFIYSNFISHDLTERIVTEYEALTGRCIDRRRIDILTGQHRLSELAELANDPEHVGSMVQYVENWAHATCRS
ncbi:Phosphotransferase enzyme family protein [Modicisalibacter muralis]|uniref:Phosphotransferase enzyme family protein n=1 Tax=Modicisalibacter muralis TaxID=119000 RepID=A0A1G9HXL4_9GAMM|nr:aminoglycoside phosphotransferase family protein [Halomonas muralis]SDL17546.1 Phosphotransferase enzyme family protein [Halomonas muralis]